VVDAANAGAVVLNNADVTSLLFDRGRVVGAAVGAAVRDRLAGDAFEVRAGAVVNATGPWTDSVSRMEHPSSPAAVRGTKGVHVAVPADRVGNRGAVTLLSPEDGRVMFVLPSGAQSIIGTTDTPTTEAPDRVRPTRAEVQYLLDCANAFFPAAKLVPDDVVAAWAGIRPLIASGNAGDPAGASREHQVLVGPRGVIAVTGGKLTTYRAMSAEVVDVVQRRMGMRVSASATASGRLPDVTNEFACTVADVLVRRTRLAFETRDHGLSAAPAIARELAVGFGWSDADVARALDDYRSEIERIFTIETSAASDSGERRA
jgi:glycerol-3-phosphate dehydrogenase